MTKLSWRSPLYKLSKRQKDGRTDKRKKQLTGLELPCCPKIQRGDRPEKSWESYFIMGGGSTLHLFYTVVAEFQDVDHSVFDLLLPGTKFLHHHYLSQTLPQAHFAYPLSKHACGCGRLFSCFVLLHLKDLFLQYLLNILKVQILFNIHMNVIII